MGGEESFVAVERGEDLAVDLGKRGGTKEQMNKIQAIWKTCSATLEP